MMKHIRLIYTTRKQNLVRAEIYVERFQSEYLGPVYTVRKIIRVQAYP